MTTKSLSISTALLMLLAGNVLMNETAGAVNRAAERRIQEEIRERNMNRQREERATEERTQQRNRAEEERNTAEQERNQAEQERNTAERKPDAPAATEGQSSNMDKLKTGLAVVGAATIASKMGMNPMGGMMGGNANSGGESQAQPDCANDPNNPNCQTEQNGQDQGSSQGGAPQQGS